MSRGPLALALALALPACGSPSSGTLPVTPPTSAAPAAAVTPTLAAVEAALLGAQAWRLEATIHAEGAFTADLRATVLATRDNRVRLDATGTFGTGAVDLHWVSDGTRTSKGEATPPHLTEAIVIGLTRMGLLHNLARLVMGGTAPDHADGGVADWVVATAPHAVADDEVAFGLTVDGKAVADSSIVIAAGPHGPVITAHTTNVDFDGAHMTDHERYAIDLAVELPSDAFVIGGGP